MPVLVILRGVLLLGEVMLALPLLYLVVVTMAALLSTRHHRKHPPVYAPPYAHFALLVPAHNEVPVLGKLLSSLAQLDYPAEAYTVCIVADNCTDATADLARASGQARVYERQDSEHRGKGFALQWLLQQLAAEHLVFDAYVVLDADSVVDSAFLQAFNHGLAQGARALQAHNTVLNVGDSPSTSLRWLALSLMNYVRPLGRNRLGGSSTLTGNGMCLSRAVLERYPWQAFGLAEDYQYYLTLVQGGEKVLYVPEALVRSEMPVTFQQMRTQDIRWEAAETTPVRQIAAHLLKEGIRQHDLSRLEAVAELLTPTLSYLVLGCVLVLCCSFALWSWLNVLVAALLLASLMFYVSSAFLLLHPPRTVFQSFLSAPGFILWKLWVVLVVRRRHQTEWVRTSRNSASS
jgi:cellulose synthase/poly-beta-1,6-N-acetylglucosamine synthase-like glycosyltransferase